MNGYTLHILLFVGLTAACSSKPTEPHVPAKPEARAINTEEHDLATEEPPSALPPAPKLEGKPEHKYVLVSSDTWLYAAPESTAHRFRVEKTLPPLKYTVHKNLKHNVLRDSFDTVSAYYDSPRRVLTFQMSEEQPNNKQWVRIEPVATQRHFNNCGFPTPGQSLNISLYVRAQKILPTLAHEKIWSFEDGTSLSLKPGVALRQTEHAGTYVAETANMSTEVKLVQSDLTIWRNTIKRYPGQRPILWARGPIVVKVGDIETTLMNPEIGLSDADPEGDFKERQNKPIRNVEDLNALNAKAPPQESRITNILACSKVVGQAVFVPFTGPSGLGGNGMYGFRNNPSVKQGSKVYWPNGNEAGTVRKKMLFKASDAKPGSKDGLSCFNSAFFGKPSITLCFLTEDVIPP